MDDALLHMCFTSNTSYVSLNITFDLPVIKLRFIYSGIFINNRAKRCFRNIYLFIIVLVFDFIETFIIVNKSINLLNAQIFLYKKRYIKFILMLYNLHIYYMYVYFIFYKLYLA